MSKKIAALYMGGTFGMAPKNPSDLESPLIPQRWEKCEADVRLRLDRYLEQNPHMLLESYEIDYISVGQPLDSSHMTHENWIRIAKEIQQQYKSYDGFVPIQRTDTMAYTASALTFIFQNLAKPVVLTGANLPLQHPQSDAIPNLALAAMVAATQRIPDVKLAFGDAVMKGCRATKASCAASETFKMPKISEFLAGSKLPSVLVVSQNKSTTTGSLELNEKLKTNILVIPCTPDVPADIYVAGMQQIAPDGVILETFEAGNVPNTNSFMNLIGFLRDNDIPTLAISQTFGGAVHFGKYDASSFLAQNNVMSGGDMTLEAAQTKMMVMLGRYSGSELRQKMESNLRGELTPVI